MIFGEVNTFCSLSFFETYSQDFQPGAGLRFSRGGRDGSKLKKKLSTFFIGRPKLVFKRSQNTKKTLFGKKNCMQQANFYKNLSKKQFLGTFWKILTKILWRVLPLKIRLY